MIYKTTPASTVFSMHFMDDEWRVKYHSYLRLHGRFCPVCNPAKTGWKRWQYEVQDI